MLHGAYLDSVKPVIEAGAYEAVELPCEIANGMGRGFHVDGQQDAHLPRRKIGLSAMHLGKADVVPKFEGLRGSQRN